MASSSNPRNQQVVSSGQDNLTVKGSDWAYQLYATTILELDAFRNFFSICHQPDIDIVVIYQQETGIPYGFGFVANELSYATGGTFRLYVDTATRLKNELSRLAIELSKIHTRSQPQSDMGERPLRKYVNYVQFRAPSLFLEHPLSNYFSNFPDCDFIVVTLFESRPCGFGFLETSPNDSSGFLETSPNDSYLNHLKWMVDALKMTISDGLARIPRSYLGQGIGSSMAYSVQQQRGDRRRGSAATEAAEISGSFLGQGITGSRMAHSVQQQQQRGERERGAAASEVISDTGHNTFGFQPTARMPRYAELNTPSSAPLWSDFQTTRGNVVGSAGVTGQSLGGSFSGGYPNPTQWPGSSNVAGQSNAVMQQQHHQQQRGDRGRGYAATEAAEISGSFLGQGITGSRMAHSVQQQQRGERERGAAASEVISDTGHNTFDFQPTARMPRYAELNTPSSAPLWSDFQTTRGNVVGSAGVTGQSLSGSFSGGYPNPTQWPGSSNVAGQSNAVMQQQQQSQSSLHSQPTAGVFPSEAVNRPSGAHMWSGPSAGVTHQVLSARPAGQLETNQWSGSIYGGGYFNTVTQQQQQPGLSIHSQTTNTTSDGFFRATDQIFSGNFAGGQPTTGEWSRAVGTNRPLPNSTAGSSSVCFPEWDIWKKM